MGSRVPALLKVLLHQPSHPNVLPIYIIFNIYDKIYEAQKPTGLFVRFRRGAIGVLLVRVVAAYDLINADWFSLSDPYAKAEWETTATNYDA